MNYIQLSGTSLRVSTIIYGVWRILQDPEGTSTSRTEAKIQTCLDQGIDTFDHADLYGDYQVEEAFGKVLQQSPALRSRMVLISKCGIQLISRSRPDTYIKHYNTSAEYITWSVETSLRKLHTDYLDVLLIHRPDPLMKADETAQALNQLIKSGKIKYAGVSNFTNEQFSLLASRMESPLVTNQIEVSLIHTSPLTDGTLDFLQEKKINPLAWSPLGGGKLFAESTEVANRVRHMLQDLCGKYNASPEQLALAWILRLPSQVVPIIGTNQLNRIQLAAQAVYIQLELQDWYKLYVAAIGKDVP